jgi:hypothetical protein
VPATSAWRATIERVAGPVAIAVAGLVMLSWTWGTWPDAVVDYGRELFLAWQVAAGRTLYVDLSHFSGPLSVELNALWFRLFGRGMWTLAIAQIVLCVGFTALLYDLLAALAGRFAATAGSLVFVLLFACAQFTRISNYNWVCPYSHELVHGAMLSVAALWALARRVRTARDGWLVAVGLALGLLVLTKVETLLAGGLAVGVGLALGLVAERPSPGRAARLVALVVAGAVPPLLLTVLVYGRQMPVETLLQWPLGHWLAAARPEVRSSAFYRAGMGLDDEGSSLVAVATAAGWEALGLAVAVAAAFALRGVAARAPISWVLAAVAASALWRGLSMDAWGAVPLAYPVWTTVLAVAAFVGFVRRGDDPAVRSQAALRVAFAVLAAAMLAKMVLNSRIYHYGFVLGMPATVVLVVALVAWLPAFVDRHGGYGGAVRALGLGVVAAGVSAYLIFMQSLVAAKTATMGRGADAFRVEARSAPIVSLLREIETRVGADETLLVVPQGAMLNYLARRRNASPYYLFDRTTRVLWGEDAVTDTVRATPPDWIAFVERGPGPDRFGRKDFLELHAWMLMQYEPVWQIGKPFGTGARPAVMLLRRKTGA